VYIILPNIRYYVIPGIDYVFFLIHLAFFNVYAGNVT
jgi:hypothetical protein